MAYFNLGGDGPYFKLNSEDVKILRENKSIEIINKNLTARISLTEHDPNLIIFPNGGISSHDMECNDGIRIRRYPEHVFPYDFKGKQYYILRIQKDLFNKLVEKSENSVDNMSYLHPRCKYDRFFLLIK